MKNLLIQIGNFIVLIVAISIVTILFQIYGQALLNIAYKGPYYLVSCVGILIFYFLFLNLMYKLSKNNKNENNH